MRITQHQIATYLIDCKGYSEEDVEQLSESHNGRLQDLLIDREMVDMLQYLGADQVVTISE